MCRSRALHATRGITRRCCCHGARQHDCGFSAGARCYSINNARAPLATQQSANSLCSTRSWTFFGTVLLCSL